MPEPLDPIPLSALQHWAYCPRQCALIHLEQAFEENVFTLRGQAVHARADQPGVETGLTAASRVLDGGYITRRAAVGSEARLAPNQGSLLPVAFRVVITSMVMPPRQMPSGVVLAAWSLEAVVVSTGFRDEVESPESSSIPTQPVRTNAEAIKAKSEATRIETQSCC